MSVESNFITNLSRTCGRMIFSPLRSSITNKLAQSLPWGALTDHVAVKEGARRGRGPIDQERIIKRERRKSV